MAWQTVDGETVLLHIDGKELLGLNAVGARVWALCDGAHATQAIIDVIAAEFAADRSEVAVDVQRFLDELDGLGALTWRRADVPTP